MLAETAPVGRKSATRGSESEAFERQRSTVQEVVTAQRNGASEGQIFEILRPVGASHFTESTRREGYTPIAAPLSVRQHGDS